MPRINPEWRAALRRTRRELVVFAAGAAAFAAVALFEPYGTEQPRYYERGRKVTRDHLTLPERLGYATLLRAGYGTARLDSAAEGRDPELSLDQNEEHPDFKCVSGLEAISLPGGERLDVKRLALAVTAAERYNRDAFQRRVEGALARAALAAGRPLPDYSYGLGQLRASTARRLIGAELRGYDLSDRDLLGILTNDCQNLRLTGEYVQELVDANVRAGGVDAVIDRVAAAYNGSTLETVHGLRYQDAVRGAYHLLVGRQVTGEEGGEGGGGDGGGQKTFCIPFALGRVDLDSSSLHSSVRDRLEREPAPTDSVSIYVVSSDPGPPHYREQLIRQRTARLRNMLVSFGLEPGRVTVRSPPEQPPGREGCGFEPDEGDSYGALDLAPDTTIHPPPPPPPPPGVDSPAARPTAAPRTPARDSTAARQPGGGN